MKTKNLLLILSICVCGGVSGQAAVIAYYRAEGTNGSQIGSTITDSSGNGRDITVSGATASDKYLNKVANDPSPIPQTGATNTTMLNIDTKGTNPGGTLSLTAASNVAWNHIFEKQAFTIEGWISPSDYLFGSNIEVAGRGNVFGTGWQLLVFRLSNTSVAFGFKTAGSFYNMTVTGLTNGMMDYFSVIGQANGDVNLSYAGQTGTILSAAYAASTDTTSSLYFFQGEKTGNFQVDEVRFSDTALSSGQLLNVVPEPSTWALLAFSLTTVTVLRRRRGN